MYTVIIYIYKMRKNKEPWKSKALFFCSLSDHPAIAVQWLKYYFLVVYFLELLELSSRVRFPLI